MGEPWHLPVPSLRHWRSVYHGSLGADSHNAVWAVEELVVAGAPPTRYLLLRGAYGRYLGAPDARDGERCACCARRRGSLGVGATQRDRDGEEVDDIMWRATRCSGCAVVEDRDARGVVLLHDMSGRYLRGNKSFLACRRSVSVCSNDENEEALRWEVVRVPRSQGRPELPIATEPDLAGLLASMCSSPLCREIRFVRADDAGNFRDGVWDSFQYEGRSVQLLRDELLHHVLLDTTVRGQCQLGDNFTLCVRGGRHGQLTPLLINLPRSREALHIVLLRHNSTAERQMIFPDVNALLSEGQEEEEEHMIE